MTKEELMRKAEIDSDRRWTLYSQMADMDYSSYKLDLNQDAPVAEGVPAEASEG